MSRNAPIAFPSEAAPIVPFDPSNEDEFRPLCSALQLVFDGRSREVSFIALSSLIYRICSFNHVRLLIDRLLALFSDYFQSWITTHFTIFDPVDPRATEFASEFIRQTGQILPRYEKVSRAVDQLFQSAKPFFRGKLKLEDELRTAFISVIGRSGLYNNITNSIA
jgi:hypothetical protein